MEHRYDRQDHAAARQVEGVGLDLGDRVQDVRAMLVEHPFEIARRPAGIAKPDRVALALRHTFEAAILGRDQFPIGKISLLHRRVDQHEMLDGRSEEQTSELRTLMRISYD